MRIIRLLPLWLIGLLALGLQTFSVASPAAAQGQNLLTNPSFEGQYAAYIPETPQEQADCSIGVCNTAQMPAGWKPWWVKERPTDVNPEYKPASRNVSGNRVRSGDRAAQYFSFWTTHKAGLRQTVSVPAGSTVQFTAWGQVWMTESDDSSASDYSGTANMQIGIDPAGGTNPFSPSVVWSGFQTPFDSYQPFSVQARAQGDQVTVFTFAAPGVNPNSPEYGFKHTDIYWDDTSLVVIGGGAPPPPPPADPGGGETAAPAPAAAAPQTQSGLGATATPDADGVIYAEVLSGDSIWAVAARAGLTLDEILELNDMTGDDFVHTGDLLIVGYAEPSGSEEEAEESTEEESAEAAAEDATPEPTNTPQQTAEVAEEEESGQEVAICLTAYDDANKNGVRDTGDELRPAVAVTISDGQSVVSNYVTDGESEPFCVEGLTAGNYRVSRSSLANEVLTSPGDRAVALTGGSTLDLHFGSYLKEETLALVSTEEQSENSETVEAEAETADAGETQSIDTMTIAIAVALIVALILIAALIIMIMRGRRSTA